MSDWFYVGLTYSLTWAVLAGYLTYLRARAARAGAALERARGGGGNRKAAP